MIQVLFTGGQKMKIGGEYILSRRSIMRIIATISAAFALVCKSPGALSDSLSIRVHDASIELNMFGRRMVGGDSRIVVPDFMYKEWKALYFFIKYNFPVASAMPTARAPSFAPSVESAFATPKAGKFKASSLVTKADLHAAVKTIIRAEDIFASKPGPCMTLAKKRQIEAAAKYRKEHAGCSVHNACLKSFVPAEGGYKSPGSLYSHMHECEKA